MQALLNSRGVAAYYRETLAPNSPSRPWPPTAPAGPRRPRPTRARSTPKSSPSAPLGSQTRSREPQELAPGQLCDDSGTGGGARSGRIHVLRFFRAGDSRSAQLPDRPHRSRSCSATNINISRRCLPPAAIRRAVRRRRRAPQGAHAGGARRRQRISPTRRQPPKRWAPKPTGHGFPLPNEYGEAPHQHRVRDGDSHPWTR